jgi:hypothetical protein
MAVDTLRSCYRTSMNFYRDGFHAVPVRWYFCSKGAKRLPFPTVFASQIWAYNKDGPWPPLGEVLGQARVYDAGLNIHGKAGQSTCMDAFHALNGIGVDEGFVPKLDCCGPLKAIPGVLVKMGATHSIGGPRLKLVFGGGHA